MWLIETNQVDFVSKKRTLTSEGYKAVNNIITENVIIEGK